MGGYWLGPSLGWAPGSKAWAFPLSCQRVSKSWQIPSPPQQPTAGQKSLGRSILLGLQPSGLSLPRTLLSGCSPQLRFAPKPSLAKGVFVILLFGGCGGQGRTFHSCKWPSYFIQYSSLSDLFGSTYIFTEASWALGPVPAYAVGNADVDSV